jgi:uncharacterized protein YodC (DUF2158 family)
MTNKQETFDVGDVVQLKSGGVKMTVYQVIDKDGFANENVHCGFFDGQGEHDTLTAPALALKKVSARTRK